MQNNSDSRKQDLQALLDELNHSVFVKEKKYFHTNTLENLIFHFEEIKSETDKNWVYEVLIEYFKECNEKTPSIDRNTSVILFKEYIEKITNYYDNNLGFVVLINRSLVYTIYFFILLMCYIFFNFYVVLAAAALIIIQFSRTFKKYKDKKVYSLFW